jgi:hypothetical protein
MNRVYLFGMPDWAAQLAENIRLNPPLKPMETPCTVLVNKWLKKKAAHGQA